MKKTNVNIDFVSVKKEPNHHEIYDSPFVRIYMARLKPGQETQYHSHDEDTIYVVVKGGEIQTINHRDDEGCPNQLLKKYSISYKLKLLLARLRKKPVYLVENFSFFMPSASKKVVHKAVASSKNKQDMLLMGIEIKS